MVESIVFIKENMATKDDVREIVQEEMKEFRIETDENFASLRTELRDIRSELADINRRLDQLEENYRNLKGVTKEIDELRERVRALEKKFGNKKAFA